MTGARLLLAVCALAAAAAIPARAEAQRHTINGVVALPAGEFAEYSNNGYGLDYAYVRRRPFDLVGLRVGGGFVAFQGVRDQICDFSPTAGCRDTYEVTTTRSILYAAAGPQLEMEYVPGRPHLFATVGIGAFRSASEGMPSEVNNTQQSALLDFVAGAGFSIPVSTISIDLGGRFHSGSRARYAPRGGTGRDEQGMLAFSPERGARAVFVVSAGVRF